MERTTTIIDLKAAMTRTLKALRDEATQIHRALQALDATTPIAVATPPHRARRHGRSRSSLPAGSTKSTLLTIARAMPQPFGYAALQQQAKQMHNVPAGSTSFTIAELTKAGSLRRVGRGLYTIA